MLALILFLVVGLLFGYFATLNTGLVSVHFGTASLENIPMYILVLASFGIGILFSGLFYLLRSIPAWLAWGKREKELSHAQKEITDLTKKIHTLELENAKLIAKSEGESGDEDTL